MSEPELFPLAAVARRLTATATDLANFRDELRRLAKRTGPDGLTWECAEVAKLADAVSATLKTLVEGTTALPINAKLVAAASGRAG